MRSRTRGPALSRGREVPALAQGAPERRAHRSRPSIRASVLGSLGSARPALPVPRHFAPGREGKGRGAGRERRGKEGTRRRHGGCRELPRHSQPGTAYPHPAEPGRPFSFLPSFPPSPLSLRGGKRSRRPPPLPPPFPLPSPFPCPIPPSRRHLPEPHSRSFPAGGDRWPTPCGTRRSPEPSPTPPRASVDYVFLSPSPSPRSLKPESWVGAGAALAGAEGAGAGRAMPRSRGVPQARLARPLKFNQTHPKLGGGSRWEKLCSPRLLSGHGRRVPGSELHPEGSWDAPGNPGGTRRKQRGTKSLHGLIPRTKYPFGLSRNPMPF